VISDYMMPGEDGVVLVHWVKEFDPDLEVILLTARDDKETVKKALRAGIFDFLEKPISKHELIKRVQAAIEKPNPIADIPINVTRFTSVSGKEEPETFFGLTICIWTVQWLLNGFILKTETNCLMIRIWWRRLCA
jgi:DNA-binding response OmpR family regulator